MWAVTDLLQWESLLLKTEAEVGKAFSHDLTVSGRAVTGCCVGRSFLCWFLTCPWGLERNLFATWMLIAGSCLCNRLGVLGLGNRVCGLLLVCWWLQVVPGGIESLPEVSVFQNL